MKKKLIILAISTLVIPAFAQDINPISPKQGEEQPDWKNEDRPDFKQKKQRKEPTDEERAEHKERRLQFMKKSLKEIGVTEEQQIQISELQQSHQTMMQEISRKVGEARMKVSVLEESGATVAEIDSAVDELADAQSEQMKLLIKNRREMEKILGKEKNEQFMESARSQFREHGRRGGSGLPPRPGQGGGKPPIPPPPTP